ncbi:ABC transporter permease [Acidihalobacter prosperus]|uniref:Spermidine Putrescine ABC transporter permease component n=1 Tax=Acidihalobacter prosperus TaxID=160660 RepID=A0A1A6C2R4_9GAMM|nr:ABC transporter permease [Acidihalobacter prosperus]OBS08848.1 Spermidine Putrescine ABC transporter permease component [Acidihalobacter prosperus]
MRRASAIDRAMQGMAIATLAFLWLPLFVVVAFSFEPEAAAVHLTGFTFDWYERVWQQGGMLHALFRSLELGLLSAAAGTVLGALLAVGLHRYRGRGFAILALIVYLPIVMPDVIYGISQMVFFNYMHRFIGWPSAGLVTMGIAHVSFQIPYVALVVYARLVGLDRNLVHAAADLYASPLKSLYAFWLPVLKPALIAGFLLAFTLSLDDFVISFFTSGPGSVTLPIYIWGSIARHGVTPQTNAIASLMIGAVLLVALAQTFFQARRHGYLSSHGQPSA